MDTTLRDIGLMLLLFAAAFAFAFSGIPVGVNRLTFHYTNATATFFELQNVDAFKDTPTTEVSIGLIAEITFAVLLISTPVAAFGGAWLIRIGVMFLVGDAARYSAFGLPGSLRALASILCVFAFFFSIYKQYYWIDRLIDRRKYIKQSKDETKLI